MANFYNIGFENTDGLNIPSDDVESFRGVDITDSVYVDSDGHLTKVKSAKKVRIVIKRAFSLNKYNSTYGLASDETVEERLKQMDIVDISTPSGETIEVPWNGNSQYNNCQEVYTANAWFGKDDSLDAPYLVVELSYSKDKRISQKDSDQEYSKENRSLKGYMVSANPTITVSDKELGNWELLDLLKSYNRRLNRLESHNFKLVKKEFQTVLSLKLKDYHERN